MHFLWCYVYVCVLTQWHLKIIHTTSKYRISFYMTIPDQILSEISQVLSTPWFCFLLQKSSSELDLRHNSLQVIVLHGNSFFKVWLVIYISNVLSRFSQFMHMKHSTPAAIKCSWYSCLYSPFIECV